MGLAAGLQRAVNFYGTESPGGANIPAPRVAQACQGWPVYHPQPAAQSLARARRRLPPQARQTEERLPAPPPGSCTCQRQVWSWEVGVVGLLKPSSPCWGATGIQIRLCLGLHSVCAGLELSRAPGAY